MPSKAAKVICTGCGATIAMATQPGTGRCSRCVTAADGMKPLPGTRSLRRRAFGQRRSRAGRLGPADRRHAADLGVIVP